MPPPPNWSQIFSTFVMWDVISELMFDQRCEMTYVSSPPRTNIPSTSLPHVLFSTVPLGVKTPTDWASAVLQFLSRKKRPLYTCFQSSWCCGNGDGSLAVNLRAKSRNKCCEWNDTKDDLYKERNSIDVFLSTQNCTYHFLETLKHLLSATQPPWSLSVSIARFSKILSAILSGRSPTISKCVRACSSKYALRAFASPGRVCESKTCRLFELDQRILKGQSEDKIYSFTRPSLSSPRR
jgi:hypothetical protein